MCFFFIPYLLKKRKEKKEGSDPSAQGPRPVSRDRLGQQSPPFSQTTAGPNPSMGQMYPTMGGTNPGMGEMYPPVGTNPATGGS
jgi:hypothetical protein